MKIFLLALCLLATSALIPLPVTDYFLEDRFTTNDPAPLTSPHVTEPGGQSITVTENDGSLSISNDSLRVIQQATITDGDLGLRYGTATSRYLGKAMFFTVTYDEINNGTAVSNASAAIGFTQNANVTINTQDQIALANNGSKFLMAVSEGASTFAELPTTIAVGDTYYVAVILGSQNNGGVFASNFWYSGITPANYEDGGAVFIKKGASGQWLLQGFSADSDISNAYAFIGNQKSNFRLSEWLVLANGDSAYDPYLNPISYQVPAGSGQLFDDTPEVGAAYDSAHGDFAIASSTISATGANAYGAGWITTTDTGDTNVFGYQLNNLTDDNSDYTGLVFRRNPADGSFCNAAIASNGNTFVLQYWSGSAITTLASATGISLQITSLYIYAVAGAVIDSTIYGWFIPASGPVVSLRYTSRDSTNYGKGCTEHGLRVRNASTGIRHARFYAAGNDGEYGGLSNFFGAGRRMIFGEKPKQNDLFLHAESFKANAYFRQLNDGTSLFNIQRQHTCGRRMDEDHYQRTKWYCYRDRGGIFLPENLKSIYAVTTP